jgi:predicted small metal-binding protein
VTERRSGRRPVGGRRPGIATVAHDRPSVMRARYLLAEAMSKELHCVVDGCEATIEAETEAEILEQAEAHAADAHPELELDEETVETLKGHIQET